MILNTNQLASLALIATAIFAFVGWSHVNLEPVPNENEAVGNLPQSTRHQDEKQFQDIVAPFLKTRCIRCHEGEKAKGDLRLDRFQSQADVVNDLDAWEEIIDAVDEQYMPPSAEPQPTEEEVQKLKDWYQKTLANQNAAVSMPAMRRLNQVEFENSVRDLLRVKKSLWTNPARILLNDEYFKPAEHRMPGYVLTFSHQRFIEKRPPLLKGIVDVPVDPQVEHGFTNNHQALSISPLQAERYFEIAKSIVTDPNFPRLCNVWESLFVPRPGESDRQSQIRNAHDRLAVFLSRAFRRSVTERELKLYHDLFVSEFEQGSTYTESMQETVAAILVSPGFLFRRDFSVDSMERNVVSPNAMAARLSYFLWATMPDDILFQAAREGRLETNSDLRHQVRRMLRDKKIRSLATDFGMQWLQVGKAASARPDRDLFPKFYEDVTFSVSNLMMIEQLLLFETILIEDRPITDFLVADFAYLNAFLIRWYGMDPKAVLGFEPESKDVEDFYRVKWTNKHRGGIITSGAALVGTSTTTRTSLVYRGAWLKEVLFNRPPPPPPADVPTLESVELHAGKPLNIREKLKRHRADPNCAVCHDQIDPLGFALESFDPVAKFRHKYPDGTDVDTKTTIDGNSLEGAALFKLAVLQNNEPFIRGFVEHMMEYALGRHLENSDEPHIDKIVKQVIKDEYRFSSVVENIVVSDLFRSSTYNN